MRRAAIAAVLAAAVVAVAGDAGATTLRLVDDPTLGAFVDISLTSGELIILGDDEETILSGSTPGNFVFPAGVIIVGMNGGLGFGSPVITDLAPINEPLPSPGAFLGGQALLGYWDDIDDKEGDVYSAIFPDRRIVQWNYGNFDGRGSTLKFQVVILLNPDPTGIYAQLLYRIEGVAAGAGRTATIGYQDGGAGFGDVPFSFDAPNVVADGTVLSLLIPGPCRADVDGNRAVDVDDVLAVVLDWECTGAPGRCVGDVNGDGAVDVDDVIEVILAWGPCP